MVERKALVGDKEKKGNNRGLPTSGLEASSLLLTRNKKSYLCEKKRRGVVQMCC